MPATERAAPAGSRESALRLAGRYAEFTGWMAQESGDETASLWWTKHAVELAARDHRPQLRLVVERWTHLERPCARQDAVEDRQRTASVRAKEPSTHDLEAQADRKSVV